MDILRDEHGLCTDMCSTSSTDENHFLFVNVDEVTEIKEEDDPELTTSAVTRTEPAVSVTCECVFPLLHTLDKEPEMFCLS
jgi:hypothetical protein